MFARGDTVEGWEGEATRLSGNDHEIVCADLKGRVASYPSKDVRFRPAAYGILRDNNQILLSRSRFTGLWDFPGGGVNPFELMADGMVREFFEETSLTIICGDLVYVAEGFIAMFGHPFHSLRYYYRCRLQSDGDRQGAADPHELMELRWWPLAELPQADMHPTDQEALHRFLSS